MKHDMKRPDEKLKDIDVDRGRETSLNRFGTNLFAFTHRALDVFEKLLRKTDEDNP